MNNLRKFRKEKGLLQKDIAKLLNVAKSTYSYWEIGRYDIDLENLKKLADFYNTTIDCLLGREEKQKKPPAEAGSYEEYLQTIKKLGIADDEQKKLFEKINNLSKDQKDLILQMVENFKDKT